MVLGWSLAHELVWGPRREVDCPAVGLALAVHWHMWQEQWQIFPRVSLEYRFFFFLLSGWATNTLLCPFPFLQNLDHRGRVCTIRSQEYMYRK